MLRIAIDVGGTFTDVVCLKDEQRLFFTKVPTMPRQLVEGILNGVNRILEIVGERPGNVKQFIHSTTIATNAILEHKGAVMGLLMTEGFEDVLEIGRQKRSQMYDLFLDTQTPVFLAPRRLRVGIRERIDADGTILKPLDEEQLVSAVEELRSRYDIQSVAVSYLFSFLDPVHERRTRELLGEHFPDLSVSISSDVDPVFREYERTCLTAFDAYVRPTVSTYLHELSRSLANMGIEVQLQVMQSRGGLTSADVVADKPVSMLLSGPASGVIGGRYAGALSGLHNAITVDIGGTSCDVALVKEGKPLISREGRIGVYPLRISMVDVNTIGAGGGSLAWQDGGGGLHVGPQSAGSDPGPICYGRGGEVPTVTDASLVLGYLNADYFAGGQLALDVEAARAGIEAMARQFGMKTEVLAAGIHRIINERTANEIRLVSVKRGYDPRQFALVPLGGAGPVHGGRLAALLSIPTVVVPEAPGVLSAFGLLVADIEHEQTRTFGARMDEVEPGRMEALFAELDALCAAKMARENVPPAAVIVEHYLDIRYVGQSYELEVVLSRPICRQNLDKARANFHELHRRVYGYDRPESPVEAINLRAVHTVKAKEIAWKRPSANRRGLAQALKETRPVYFEEVGKYRETPIYQRELLPQEEPLSGPAVIEQADTTTVLYVGHTARVDALGNLIITPGKGV